VFQDFVGLEAHTSVERPRDLLALFRHVDNVVRSLRPSQSTAPCVKRGQHQGRRPAARSGLWRAAPWETRTWHSLRPLLTLEARLTTKSAQSPDASWTHQAFGARWTVIAGRALLALLTTVALRSKKRSVRALQTALFTGRVALQDTSGDTSGPIGPVLPLKPLGPGQPCGPFSPCGPVGPRSPSAPCGPW
jgi:hypothetical protein